MIIITGAAGFIGSCLVNKLNNKGFSELVAVDDFSRPDKMKNLEGKIIARIVHRNDFFEWFNKNHREIAAVYHLGARTDTTETDTSIFDRLNLNYSKTVFSLCASHNIPLVYASSAATYGSGISGYSDDHDITGLLKPLNPYGHSKNDFDNWVLQQIQTPPFWAGMKFFNVYGPNEYHKGRMASVVFHAFRQIREEGRVRLFRSHNPGYADGEQVRDFIYIKDVVSVLLFMMNLKPASGLYNLGSGIPRSFKNLAVATFDACDKTPVIDFIDTPVDIRDKYQYYTCAQIDKLRGAGYNVPFFTLEEGITDYVKTYLLGGLYY